MSLLAKIDGKWGQVPDYILPALPPRGVVSSYEFCYHFTDPVTKQKSWKNSQALSPIVRIIDPKTKRPIEIGLIGGIELNGAPVAHEIRVISLSPNLSRGTHHFTSGNSIDSDELWQFFELTSENESSPYRDNGIEPIFRKIDHAVS